MKYATGILVLLVVFISIESNAQVTIAPPLVIVDRENPFGSYVVVNKSYRPLEISISFRYGYPASDEQGNIFMSYIDEPESHHRSAVDWVRAFPRRFILEPMQEQTVRLSVRPGGPVDDGTYTARIITTSKQTNNTVDVASDNAGLSTSINFQFNQVSALMYRFGKVTTGVEVIDVTTQQSDEVFDVFAYLEKKGNSPYIGTAVLRVFGKDGYVIDEKMQSIALYNDMVRRFQLDVDTMSPGEYNAEIIITTEGRSDVTQSALIRMPDVKKTFLFLIQ